MYPISMGFSEVSRRLDVLVQNGHYGEAMLSSVFCAEKSVRRSLRFCLLSRGFSSKQCDALLKGRGLESLKTLWPVFSKNYESLPDFFGQNNWSNLKKAAKMRNDVVHGNAVFKLVVYEQATTEVRDAIAHFRKRSIIELSCDPWAMLPGSRRSKLEWNALKQPNSAIKSS